MKLNSTVALTLILLTLMFGAGVVSAAWGFALGSQALKGITQPDTRPTNKVANRKNATNRSEELVVLREEDILKRVKERIGMPAREPLPTISPTKKPEASPKTPNGEKVSIVSQNQGVTLEVIGIRRQTGSLVMDVTLQNTSAQSVQFRYRFLNVFDDQGNVINAETAGLPEELPPRSVKFTGTITIAEPLLGNTQKLSMQLSDYPDQKLQLQMSDILVK